MSSRLRSVGRFFLQLLLVILQAGLIVWAACAPLVWILRDGLGPGTPESGSVWSVFKFLVQWSVPALALAGPLLGLKLVDRRMARAGKA
jgi:hypothetical protein